MRKRTLRLLCLLAVVGLVGAACGSEREDADTSSATTAAGGTAASTTAPAAVTFGDLASPCGKGDAKGATQQGVTDTQITIGYGDDAGFASSPGLNHHQSDAIKAMIKWCNEQGGINGRQIVGKYGDAKILEVNNVMLDMCKSVFMLVGQGWSLDSLQEETRVGCKMASIPAWGVSPEFANGPLTVQPVPNPVDLTPVQNAAQIAKQFPDKITKTAVMYANYAATIDTKDKVLESYPPFGFQFLNCPQEYNINGEPDWKPFINSLKSCGAEIVYFTGSPIPNFQNVLLAAQQLSYKPIWVVDANFYDQAFADWNGQNGGVADNVHARMAFIPFEEASSNKATADYVKIVQANKGDIALLGAQATSAFLLWATAAKACGSNLTSQCVLDEAKKVTKWTGGGLHAETNPGTNQPPQCGFSLKLSGNKYVRAFPTPDATTKFDCSAQYVKQVKGAVVQRVGLGADRVVRKYEK
jgi:hypothetical protein